MKESWIGAYKMLLYIRRGHTLKLYKDKDAFPPQEGATDVRCGHSASAGTLLSFTHPMAMFFFKQGLKAPLVTSPMICVQYTEEIQ